MHIFLEGPWAIDGALLVLEQWRPNLVIGNLQLDFISICVQIHGLPLEYQYPELAEKNGSINGNSGESRLGRQNSKEHTVYESEGQN